MSELSIPALSLFHRTAKSSATASPARPHSRDLFSQNHYIPRPVYCPQAIPIQRPHSEVERRELELEYLKTYQEALRREEISQRQPSLVAAPYFATSFHKSFEPNARWDSVRSFGAQKTLGCGFEQQQQHFIAKNAYLSHERMKLPSTEQKKADVGVIINKSPYLSGHSVQGPRNEPPIDKSVMVNDSLKEPLAEVEIQTDDPNLSKSSFAIYTGNQLDQENFRRKIKGLQQQIDKINVELDKDDLIIDLSELILAKDQYMEESNMLLFKLKALSSGNPASGGTMKSPGCLVWPEGV